MKFPLHKPRADLKKPIDLEGKRLDPITSPAPTTLLTGVLLHKLSLARGGGCLAVLECKGRPAKSEMKNEPLKSDSSNQAPRQP